jgi:cytochrome c biogenesis protein CcmG, thiol:disulfide interchange protein DsbE
VRKTDKIALHAYHYQRISIFLWVGIIAALLLVALLLGLTYQQRTIEPELPQQIEAETPTVIPPAVDQDAPHVLALINGEPITEDSYHQIQAVDEAITALFGLPTDSPQDRLARMINTELVMQSALLAGFPLAEAEAQGMVDQLLERYERTPEELILALESKGVDLPTLVAYLAHSLTADRFLATESDEPAVYLHQLQQSARISLGPGASLLPVILEEPTPQQAFATPDSPPIPAQPLVAELPPSRGVALGNLLPDFTLPLLDQADSLNADDLIGQPTVLSFFTTWCPYCRQQTPLLVETAARYESQGIRFVGIDVKEDPIAVENYVATYQIPYPVALDSSGVVANAYGVNGYPTTYFIDAQGRIHARHIGALAVEPLDQYLTALLLTLEQ